MLKLRTVAVVLAAGTVTFAATRPLVQEMQFPKPTQEHAELQQSVGEWQGTITMFMPGMPEQKAAASEIVRSAGPFWIQSEFTSEFMGMPYKGYGAHGFDPNSGQFTSTWIDNFSSFLSVMKGTHNAETDMIVMEWDAPDMTGQMAPHRSEQKHSKDSYTMTFYTSDVKTMVIEMNRKGSAATNASAQKQAR